MRDRQPRQDERFWHVVTGDIGAIAISAGPWLAVVSSDDNYLLHGGGASASIWQVAGPKLANAVSDQIEPPLDIGQVVETDAGDIPAKRVLHAITIDVDTGVRLDVDDARAMFDRLAQALIQLHRRSRDAPRRILVPLIGSGAGRLPFMMVTEALVSIIERLEPHGLSIVVCCDKPWVASRLETAIGQRYGKAFSAGDGSAREDWSQLVQELLRLLSRPPRSAPESGEDSQAHRWSDFIAESLGGEATEDRERKRAVQIAVHERNLLTHGLRDPGRESIERMLTGVQALEPWLRGGPPSEHGRVSEQMWTFLAKQSDEHQGLPRALAVPWRVAHGSDRHSKDESSTSEPMSEMRESAQGRADSRGDVYSSTGAVEPSVAGRSDGTDAPRSSPDGRDTVEPGTAVGRGLRTSAQHHIHTSTHVDELVQVMMSLDGDDLQELEDLLDARGYRGDRVSRVTEHCAREDPREVLGAPSHRQLRAIYSKLGGTISRTASREELIERILMELGFRIPSRPRGLHDALAALRVLRSQARTCERQRLTDLVISGSAQVMRCVRDLLRFVCLHLYGVGPEMHFKGRSGYGGRSLSEVPDGTLLQMLEWLASELEAADSASLKELGGPLTSARLAPRGTAGIARVRNIFAHAKEEDRPSSPLSRRAAEFFDAAIDLLEWWLRGEARLYPHIVRIDRIEIDIWNRRQVHATSDSGEAELIITSKPVRVGRLYYMFPVSNPWRIEPVLIEHGYDIDDPRTDRPDDPSEVRDL